MIPLVLSLPTGFEAGLASKVFHPAIVRCHRQESRDREALTHS